MNKSNHPVLRVDTREFEVGEVEMVVGRDDDCAILFDDPLVSRRHAPFRYVQETLWVRDLGSRNGVKVNGKRIGGEMQLRVNDVVVIGGNEIRVHVPRMVSGAVTRVAVDTLTNAPELGEEAAIAKCWALGEKALEYGDVREAESRIGEGLSKTYVSVAAGRLKGVALDEPTRWALRLASATSNGKWIDWIFRTHEAARRVLPVQSVEELDRVTRTIRYRVGSAMKSYVERLTAGEADLGPSEKFALRRVQALVRTLLAS